MIGHVWAMLRRPTLLRRLMMAQMLMLTVLWSLAVAYVLVEGTGEASNVGRGVLHAIISVADNLAGQPQRQEQSLRAIDEALREEFEMGQVPELAPRILVWREGKLLYKSPDAPSGIRSAGPDQMEVIYIKGQAWRSCSLTEGATRVTVLEVGGPWQFFIAINSHGYYLLPLLISLPFLLVPAWLSIRLAMPRGAAWRRR